MGAGSAHAALYRPGTSAIHALPPQCKLVALVAFVLTVVATPARQYWAFAVHLALLAAVAAVARVPPGLILRRMTVEVPFLLFAATLPFVARGPRIDVLGLSLSENGLVGAWNLAAKGSLGVVAAIVLTVTTDLRRLLRGLERLRVPTLFVQIATFMLRYADVVTDDLRRMRIARESRGFEARSLRQLPVLAAAASALFLRSYERGERVHLAMLSRGYDGHMPVLSDERAPRRAWASAATLPLAGLAVALSAWAAGA
ncbi:MAG: cobalt ECF transporter T component CbiQ [Actinomycetota bacterium]|nr:cobalt ECF transporter T component CbiQ [Actinomycetota bacterium]